jgi:peptidoglycan glycosyltransferase
VQAFLGRSRNLRLTIDARLQYQTADIVSRAARAAGIRSAAAVVLDAETGEVLASVSYPWPAREQPGALQSSDALLDRARYGLYPPGSTFKLVTAAAALREDPDLNRFSFTCARLPGDRAGVKIPGWSRPVRDDVLDRHPHGSITMHDGLVRSCNAYFAQLAVRLGSHVMAGTASLAGISLSTSDVPARTRANLPHTGYGQGDVLASPLRMARVAAAIGSDGTLRDAPLVVGSAPPGSTSFLSSEAARLLGGYMRDVVTEGTGRLLKGHPVPIAGKTGTAEVDDEASHAWFVGFAPHGPATRRIAFAVLLEHAGYGGASAAAVAGQIVTAAASLGLAR